MAVAGTGLTIDPARHVVQLDGVAVPLTPAEVDLLAAMASRPGHAWSRGELVREVWQGEFIESDFLVDVHVGNVRRKLRARGRAGRVDHHRGRLGLPLRPALTARAEPYSRLWATVSPTSRETTIAT